MSNRKSISRDDIQRQKYIAEHAPALAGQIANGIAASGKLIDPKNVAEAAILLAGELCDQLTVEVQ